MRPPRLAAVVAVVLAATALAPLSSTGSAGAAAGDPIYRPLSGFEPSGARVRVEPRSYAAYRVDVGRLHDRLATAPAQDTPTSLTVEVPTPSGALERFAVQRTAVLAPALAAQHPEIVTLAGRSLDHRGTTIALDVTQMGLHAAVRGPNGQSAWYVDPAYDRAGTTEHLAYRGSAMPAVQKFVEREAPKLMQQARPAPRAAKAATVRQKIYRVALLSDPSYARYFGSANVLAEKATLMARVNQLYNQDLAIQMQLINQTPLLNLDTNAKASGANGPCGAHPCFDPPQGDTPGQLDFCDVPTLGRQRTVLGQLVGAANYDIGHLALGVNGGGIAYLGVVGADYKGGGCTGLPAPKGDFYAIDYVAHEMGHQYAGNHTFDGVQYACSGGNRNGRTSTEPGSGSSIMAYAGICLQDDLQPHTDPYFNAKTLDEINAYTSSRQRSVEVQTVSLRGFDTDGESITLGFGSAAPQTVTRGTTYNRAGLEAAIETLTGRNVTVAGWGYDPFNSPTYAPAPLTAPDDTGFQVIFSPTRNPLTKKGPFTDVQSLTVASSSAGVSGFVGETAKGGQGNNKGRSTRGTADHAPTVKWVTKRHTIPVRTPFVLTGRGADRDGDRLSYLWEQTDIGRPNRGTRLVSNQKVYGPLFRVFGSAARVTDRGTLESPSPGENLAGGNPTRFFPNLEQVLNGNTNAKTGLCPKVPPLPADLADYEPVKPRARDCYSEFLPNRGYLGSAGGKARVLHFRMTVRDGRGGVAYRNTSLRLAQKTGPFRVVSQAKRGLVARGGDTITVRWSVNGTQRIARRVTILLSTSGGRAFGYTLAKNTANDGSATVRIPARAHGANARIMVKARGGVFYSVNARGFRVR